MRCAWGSYLSWLRGRSVGMFGPGSGGPRVGQPDCPTLRSSSGRSIRRPSPQPYSLEGIVLANRRERHIASRAPREALLLPSGRLRFQLLGTPGRKAQVAAPHPGGRRPPELRLPLARPCPPAARGSAQKLKPRRGGCFRRPTISVSLRAKGSCPHSVWSRRASRRQ